MGFIHRYKGTFYVNELNTDSLEVHWYGKDGQNLKQILANITEFSDKQKALEQDLKNRGVYEKQKTLAIKKTTMKKVKLIIKTTDGEQTTIIDSIELNALGSKESGMSLVDIMKEILKEIITSSSTSVSETLKSLELNQ